MALTRLTKDMLVHILNDLDSDEMIKLKFLLMDVVESRKLMTITNASDLLSSIENNKQIDVYNGHFLAVCFELMGRTDLISRLGFITTDSAEKRIQVNPFRVLLYKISKALSSDDEERLTFYCLREFKLTRREIESINSALDLFVLLQKRAIIDVNAYQLRKILQSSLPNRGDLFDLIFDYCGVPSIPKDLDSSGSPKKKKGGKKRNPLSDDSDVSEDDLSDDDIDGDIPVGFYEMTSNPRGICVIINNKKFTNMKPREGTDVDQARLEATFKKLGFMVVIYRDVACKDMSGIMKYISIMDHSKFDAFVVCILSYDGYNFVYSMDEKGGITYTHRRMVQGDDFCPKQGAFVYGIDDKPIPIRYITSYFLPSKCETLANKPKVFFLLTWQGDEMQTDMDLSSVLPSRCKIADTSIGLDVVTVSGNSTETDADLLATVNRNVIPDQSDFLFGCATVFGDVSYINRSQGSFYIKSLTENLDDYAHILNLEALMVKVNRDVTKMNVGEGEQARNKEKVQGTLTTLRKFLFFSPKHLQ